MATRSTIAVQHADGTISEVYCHWDGYLSNNGDLLAKNYNSLELAEELVSLGDISSLHERIHPTAPMGFGHTFDNPEKGVTVYYRRDRGEDGTAPARYRNLSEYAAEGGGQEYNYIFFNGEWYVRSDNARDYMTISAALALENNQEE